MTAFHPKWITTVSMNNPDLMKIKSALKISNPNISQSPSSPGY